VKDIDFLRKTFILISNKIFLAGKFAAFSANGGITWQL
jgi:hypothetical protein